jgi:hypothetical protein
MLLRSQALSSLADLAQSAVTVFKAVVNLWTVSLNVQPYPLCGDLYYIYINTTVCTALVEPLLLIIRQLYFFVKFIKLRILEL